MEILTRYLWALEILRINSSIFIICQVKRKGKKITIEPTKMRLFFLIFFSFLKLINYHLFVLKGMEIYSTHLFLALSAYGFFFLFVSYKWEGEFKLKYCMILQNYYYCYYYLFLLWHRRTSFKLVAYRKVYSTIMLIVNQISTGNWLYPLKSITR